MASSPSSHLVIRDIHSLPQKDARTILERITRLEKRTFPPSEAFDFHAGLWKKKPNTRVIYAQTTDPTACGSPASGPTATTTTTTTADNSATAAVVAYAVYVRMKGTALLHKICVAEAYRGRGFGGQLMAYILEQRLPREGCQSVQLWVDRDRAVARRLYARSGFVESESVEDYYGKGRTGIKMVLGLR